ncbi:MAG TPA: M24 family metallopeptidase [Lacibacter sp.]|nr:M24 family metallopeptidase [Lacibacter sp.]HMO90073.1 M24 family metallopeptidase [Lacibacter sp.]HMP85740.1 M24 family metallopeptidase [Lacibacter sp.]
MIRLLFYCCITFFLHTTSLAQALPLREQARVLDELLGERLNQLLPQLMDRHGTDMWVIISREYNEDPVLKTMLPATWLSARRRTILVFYRDAAKEQFEKLAIARYNVGEHIQASWDLQRFPDQWDQLVDIIRRRNPRKIAVNTSAHFGHADGLVHTEQQELMARLPAPLRSRVVSAEALAVAWLETRTEREMQYYPFLVQTTHRIIREGFSEQVITPGITTTDDVVWWFRQRIRELGFDTWFHPSVSVQRSDSLSFEHLRSFSNRPKDEVIRPGDLLHVDIGITYLRLNTDIQQHAYVLRPGETEVPAGIRTAFVKANRLQDILTGQFVTGRTGNQILAAALAQAKTEGIEAVIYTHPLGFHGHAAGPTIGLWDQQGGVPGSGDYPLYPGTGYSIELNAAHLVPEWNKTIRIMLEEDGYFDEKGFRYINGRQRAVHLIPRPQPSIGLQ